MSYDGITLSAVCRELDRLLSGSRLEKIHQPGKYDLQLVFRGDVRLVCSADARFARVHLTSGKAANPPVAPAFCMLLRKHLGGARLQKVQQAGLDRVVTLVFRHRDDIGLDAEKHLICEIMGKHSNIILAAPGEKGLQILGSIKMVPWDKSRHRAVLPGEVYVPPPAQEKLDLEAVTEELLAENFMESTGKNPAGMLVDAVMGPGPQLAGELVYYASAGEKVHPLELTRALAVELKKLAGRVKNGHFSPCITYESGGLPSFSLFADLALPAARLVRFDSVNEALDCYFRELLAKNEEKELRHRLAQAVNSALAKTRKKIALQEKELAEMENAEKYRLYGEMLAAGMHLVKPGASAVEVTNYYSPEQEKLVVPLDPAVSPQENIRRYFKKYKKLRDGHAFLKKRLEESNAERVYLESLAAAIEHADLPSLLEVEEEMDQAGLLRSRSVERKTEKEQQSQPLKFMSSDNIPIYVGRNNRQNDWLTLKFAAPDDTWLHVKDAPGAHVLVKSADPPQETLKEAAVLAVRYSRASQSANVPVDYTKARYVRKPRGAKPGMVIYDHHKTLFVTI